MEKRGKIGEGAQGRQSKGISQWSLFLSLISLLSSHRFLPTFPCRLLLYFLVFHGEGPANREKSAGVLPIILLTQLKLYLSTSIGIQTHIHSCSVLWRKGRIRIGTTQRPFLPQQLLFSCDDKAREEEGQFHISLYFFPFSLWGFIVVFLKIGKTWSRSLSRLIHTRTTANLFLCPTACLLCTVQN